LGYNFLTTIALLCTGMRTVDVWTVIRTTMRRWYVSAPILVVCLGLGLIIVGHLDPLYSAKSSAILAGPSLVPVPGTVTGRIDKVNPFLNLGGSLYTTTQVLTVLMDSEPKRAELDSRGVVAGYKVDRTEAVISFQVTGTHPGTVVSDANTLVRIADEEMVKLQGVSGVSTSPPSRIRVVALAVPEVATPDSAAKVKLFGVFGMLGLVLALSASVALDSFLKWSQSRAPEGGATSARRRPAKRRSARAKGTRVATVTGGEPAGDPGSTPDPGPQPSPATAGETALQPAGREPA
jgi:hypothetical protein